MTSAVGDKGTCKKLHHKGNVTTLFIFAVAHVRRLNAADCFYNRTLSTREERILPCPVTCRPNLSAFFDSGHGFVYAANFLLTFLDHTSLRNARIPRDEHRSRVFECTTNANFCRFREIGRGISGITVVKKHPVYTGVFSDCLTYLRLKNIIIIIFLSSSVRY